MTEIWVNIGSGNGLLPDGTEPVPEPLLNFCGIRLRAMKMSTEATILYNRFDNHMISMPHINLITNSSPRGQWVSSTIFEHVCILMDQKHFSSQL